MRYVIALLLFSVIATAQVWDNKLNVDNLQLDGNTISSTDTNGAINLTPNGSGSVLLPNFSDTNTEAIVNDGGASFDFRVEGDTLTGLFLVDGSQDAVGINATPDASSIFDVSTTAKGARPFPSMTTAQRDAISTPATGLHVYNTDTDKINFYNGTAWAEVSGSGSGIKNFLSGDSVDFEGSVGDWVAYADSGATPTDGTGGSPSVISIAQTTTSGEILEGTASLELSHSAADGQGEGISVDFDIDPYYSKVGAQIWVYFLYENRDSNYASGDLKAYIYNKDDAELLGGSASSAECDNAEDGDILANETGATFSCVFEAVSSSDSYRLILHQTTTNASASDISIDDVKLTVAVPNPTPILEGWKSVTCTGSWSTNTTYTCLERRVGDELEVQAFISLSGAPTSTTFTLTIPGSRSIDENKLSGGSSVAQNLGYGRILDSGTEDYPAHVQYIDTTTVRPLQLTDAAGTPVSAVNQSSPFTFASGDSIQMFFRVPIANWNSGNAVPSGQLHLQTIYAAAYGNPASATTGNPLIFPTEVEDIHSAYNASTGLFTAPKAGKYKVCISGETNSVSVQLNLAVDGATDHAIARANTNMNGISGCGSAVVTKNQTLSVEPNATLNMASGEISFEFVTDLTVIGGIVDGAIKANSINNIKSVAFKIDCDGSSSQTEDNYNAVSTVSNISGGACTMTLETGLFDNFYDCTADWTDSETRQSPQITHTSVTSLTIDCDSGAGACSDWDAVVRCQGQ